MAELTTPFLLASALLEPEASIEEWLHSVHVQPRWLDEFVAVSASAELHNPQLKGAAPEMLTFLWPGWLQSQQYLLQQVCREIATGERRMILLISEADSTTAALLLAAPAAVGIYNLIPQAYFDAWFSLHLPGNDTDLLNGIAGELKKVARKPEQLNALFLAASSLKKPVKSGTPFASATWTKPVHSPAAAPAACIEVLHSLEQSQKKNGLAVEVDAALNLFGLWIERI